MPNLSATKKARSPMMSAPLIKARNLWRSYHRGQERVDALSDVSLDLEAGCFAFVVGPSGGGKSTLLHLLGGIDRPTSGSLSVNGFDLEKGTETDLATFRRDNIGFVFQFYNLLPALNATENVALPLMARGLARRAALAKAEQILEQVGLTDRRKHKPDELSGGEQQRVAIARAVIGEPCLVLADEPTGDLDADSTESVMDLMLDLNQQMGTTILIATHNEALCQLGNQVFELHNGQLQVR